MAELSNVPLEISEAIIDLHKEDRDTLIACALTCRSWLPRSRYHLFKSIHCRRPQSIQSLAKTLTSFRHIDGLVKVLNIYQTKEQHRLHGFSLFSILLSHKLTHHDLEHIRIERDYAADPRPPPLQANFFFCSRYIHVCDKVQSVHDTFLHACRDPSPHLLSPKPLRPAMYPSDMGYKWSSSTHCTSPG